MMKKLLFSLFIILIATTLSCGNKDSQEIKRSNCIEVNKKNSIKPMQLKIINPIRIEKIDFFSLIILQNENSESIYNSYILFIQNNQTKNLYKLFTLSHVSIDRKLKKIVNCYYSYEYFAGGNNVNSECFQLIKITKNNVFLIGPYKEYEDIDGDNEKDFYFLVDRNVDKSHVNLKYKKVKIKILDNKFIYPK